LSHTQAADSQPDGRNKWPQIVYKISLAFQSVEALFIHLLKFTADFELPGIMVRSE
jgi:hypothetical protein